jgi:hypothetical protein
MTKIHFKKRISTLLFCFFIIGLLSNTFIPNLNDSDNVNKKELQLIIPKVADIPNAPILQSIGSPDYDGYINLNWSLVNGADSYNIYQFNYFITEINGSISLINFTSALSCQDQLISNGTYYYSITAVNASGESQPSNCEWVIINFPNSDYKYATGVEGKDWVVGELPTGFTTLRSNNVYEDLTNFKIISEFDKHEKVLQIFDTSFIQTYEVVKSFPAITSKGFFSGFVGCSSERNITIEVKTDNDDHGPTINMYNGQVYARVDGTNIFTGATYDINELFHFAIQFDTESQIFDFYWNGVFYGSFGFYEYISYLNQISIKTRQDSANYYLYLDALTCPGSEAANPFVNLCPQNLQPIGPNLHTFEPLNTNWSINLSWDEIPDSDFYFVYRHDNIITDLNSSLTLINTPIENFTQDYIEFSGVYYYVVCAFNESGISQLSNCEKIIITTYDCKYATGVEGKDWVVGELPTGFTTLRTNNVHEDLINFKIISEFDKHEKVLQIYDDSFAYRYEVVKLFNGITSKGFFSGFVGCSSEENNITIEVETNDFFNDHGPTIYMYNGQVYARVYGTNIFTGATYNINELYHFAIQFDIKSQTFDFYWNGVFYGSFGFYEYISYLNQICIETWSSPANYYLYLDALICPGSEAANPFVNLYPQNLQPIGPNLHTFEPLNTNGSINLSWGGIPDSDFYFIYRHDKNITDLNSSLTLIDTTIENFTQDYIEYDGVYYYAVCAFNESGISQLSNCEKIILNITVYDYKYAMGVEGKDWNVGELPTGFITTRSEMLNEDLTNFQIISKFIGHEKVLQIFDDSSFYYFTVLKSFPSHTKGFCSGFIGSSSETKNITLEVKNGNYASGPVIYMDNGQVYARVYGTDIFTGATYNINELFHFVIEFDCVTKTYDFYWNGDFFGNFGFYESVSTLNQLCITSWRYESNHYIYVDAIIVPGSGTESLFVNLIPYELLPNGPILHEVVSPDNDGKIILTWDIIVGFNNYNVYRYTSQITELNDSLTFIGKINISRICDILSTNGTYYYVITAINHYWETKMSNIVIVEIIVSPDPPLAPTLYQIDSPDDDGTFIVEWSSVENAETYLLFRQYSIINDLEGLTPIFTGQDLSYTETNLGEGTYFYCVIAINGTNWSEVSNNDMVIVKILPDFSSNDGIIGFPKEILFLSLGMISIVLVGKVKRKLNNNKRRI